MEKEDENMDLETKNPSHLFFSLLGNKEEKNNQRKIKDELESIKQKLLKQYSNYPRENDYGESAYSDAVAKTFLTIGGYNPNIYPESLNAVKAQADENKNAWGLQTQALEEIKNTLIAELKDSRSREEFGKMLVGRLLSKGGQSKNSDEARKKLKDYIDGMRDLSSIRESNAKIEDLKLKSYDPKDPRTQDNYPPGLTKEAFTTSLRGSHKSMEDALIQAVKRLLQ
ncbi:MAG: hypothetical protein HQK52_19730 [Oligoflexia bacterium]|nr:hypothetical protein [Oligoflexia bacterium]